MIRQKDSSQGHRSTPTALFIAGLPSQISLETVLAFLLDISPYFSLPSEESQKQKEHQLRKGCCVVLCHDPYITQLLLDKRFLSFCGRTLTIMQQKTGVGLIIQNKKLKKCRVILKKVPRHLGETHLRHLLESIYGPLQILFQLKCNDPFDRHLTSKNEGTKYLTYSAYFMNAPDAKRLLTDGAIQIDDGSLIIANKHTETANSKREFESCLAVNQENYPHGFDSHKNETLESQRSAFQIPHNNQMKKGKQFELNFAFHQCKPSQKGYYSCFDLGNVRAACVLDKTKTSYRLNYISSNI